jgi:hypothetical protein
MSNTPPSTPGTLISQIEAQQALLGLSNEQLCTALRFEQESVLALIKRGVMKIPLTKIPALSAALELDVSELFRVALRESDPGLSEVIEDVFNPMRLSATEVNLINHVRELSGNRQGTPLVFDGRTVIALVAA